MRSRSFVGVVGMVVMTAVPASAGPSRELRPVRATQDAAELGFTAGVSASADGALVVTAHAAGLNVEKHVYGDGLFSVLLAFGRADKVVISGDIDGIAVASGREPAVRLRPGTDREIEQKNRRVRSWLAASPAIDRFRQLVEVLDRQDARGAEALSLRATGALVGELLGDPGAARRFGRSIAPRGAGLRLAQQYTQSCWDVYNRLVNNAAWQLESCIASFASYNPLRQVCAFVWVMQVESAWFQFLSCSAVPLK